MHVTRYRTVAAATAGVLAAGTVGLATMLAPAASAAPRDVVHVRIDKGHVVHLPSQLRPGMHRFEVKAAKGSELQLAHKRAGYSDRELARDINAAMGQGNIAALKRFERNVTLLGGIDASPGHPGVMYASLTRGSYVAVDVNVPASPSKISHFRISGRHLSGAAPSGPVIRATQAVNFAARPASIPRKGWLTFANQSSENHFVEIARLQPGKTIADFKAWIDASNAGQNLQPPIDQSVDLTSGNLGPRHRMTWHYQLPAGNYVLTCFWPDADMGGMPHAFMGMYRALTVR